MLLNGFVHIVNSIGYTTEPCGTPELVDIRNALKSHILKL